MKGGGFGAGSHCQVTGQPSRQAWKGRSPRNRRDLVRGRRGAWGSQDGMDLPDPIGWQLERKQRENRREKEGERAGKARATKPSRGGTGGQGKKKQVGVGKGSGIEERDNKEGGREELEMGVGQSFTGGLGWGLGWRLGRPSPCHAHWSLTHHQAAHPQLQTRSDPSGFPLLWSPYLATHWPRAAPSLREYGAVSPMEQPPGPMEKIGERTLFEPGGQSEKDGWREHWRPLLVGRKPRSPSEGTLGRQGGEAAGCQWP